MKICNPFAQVISVENNMKTPKSFGMVMSVAMTIICVLYAVFGFFGYMKYDKAEGSVTLNVNKEDMYVTKVFTDLHSGR